jgi:bleomycin hydrolase
MKNGQSHHNHKKMVDEMKAYLESIKQSNSWNSELTISTIKSIMDFYMGQPPKTVKVDGKEISPQQYLKDVLKLVPDDYIDVMSLVSESYWKKVEYKVEDNWWHSADYYNVPLEVYMDVLKKSIRNGYTVCIGGDTSESGFDSWSNVAVVPTYDIPSEYIDEYARQLRFSNKTTTDDHGMHLVGFKEIEGKDWYLIKDSGAGSRNCSKESKNFGYYFFHEDYIKLKIMDFMVHKDMFKDHLNKF